MAQVAMIASRQLVWSWASVSCVRYPLYELEGEGFGARRKRQDGAPSTVSQRLSKGAVVSKICEEIFDRCISHDPKQTQGIGGDNMTCTIVMCKP